MTVVITAFSTHAAYSRYEVVVVPPADSFFQAKQLLFAGSLQDCIEFAKTLHCEVSVEYSLQWVNQQGKFPRGQNFPVLQPKS